MSPARSGVDLRSDLDDGIDGAAQLDVIVPVLGMLVAEVRPIDLALSTPCEGWTTRDLLNHVVGGSAMFADAFEGAPVRDISGRLPDVIGDDPAAAFLAAATRFGEATQAPGAMERVLELPWGPMTVRNFLRFVAFDLLIHSWDLAVTLGTELEVPDGVVVEADAFARIALDGWTRDGINFSGEAHAPQDASALERVVAYTGRELT